MNFVQRILMMVMSMLPAWVTRMLALRSRGSWVQVSSGWWYRSVGDVEVHIRRDVELGWEVYPWSITASCSLSASCFRGRLDLAVLVGEALAHRYQQASSQSGGPGAMPSVVLVPNHIGVATALNLQSDRSVVSLGSRR